VVAGFVVLGSLTMMVCGVLGVLGRDLMVVAALVRLRAHVIIPWCGLCREPETVPVV
jgi:hypothetical protein